MIHAMKYKITSLFLVFVLLHSANAMANTCNGLTVQVTVQNESADNLISLLNSSAKLPLAATLFEKDPENSLVIVKLDEAYAKNFNATAFDAAKMISEFSAQADLNVTAISAGVRCSVKTVR